MFQPPSAPSTPSILTESMPGNAAQVKVLEELRAQFTVTTAMLQAISEAMLGSMERGLAAPATGQEEDAPKGAMPMLPSCIYTHPTGDEVGEAVTLELTGEFVKVYLVHLQGQEKVEIKQKKFHLDAAIHRSSLQQLLDTLASMVDQFLASVGRNHQGPILPLGFVVSFPLIQDSIHRASVAHWSKSFNLSGFEGKNIAEILQIACQRLKLPIKVVAVVNNATASLLANDYRRKNTLVSCAISTGTNAAYWETTSCIQKLQGQGDETIINTEWSTFGESCAGVLPVTMYDNRLNRHSEHHGKNVYEKMVSGRYLGELVRWILVELLDRRLLFDGEYTTELNTPYAFDTSYIAQIASDVSPQLDITGHILEDVMGLSSSTLTTRKMVKVVCELVCQRAARLVAAGIATVINKRVPDLAAASERVTVSIEGSVYDSLPSFPRRLHEGLRRLFGTDLVSRIDIKVTKDDNGIGGAIAAIMSQQT